MSNAGFSINEEGGGLISKRRSYMYIGVIIHTLPIYSSVDESLFTQVPDEN